jgi:hypothetical protein
MKTAVLHSSRTFVSGKMTISQRNRDVINAFNFSAMSFYGKGYYYHSQISRMNAGPQLSWKGQFLINIESRSFFTKWEPVRFLLYKTKNTVCYNSIMNLYDRLIYRCPLSSISQIMVRFKVILKLVSIPNSQIYVWFIG